MGKKVSISYFLSADGGAEGDVVLYEVEAAKRFVTKSVYIAYPPATYFELELAIFRGIKQIAPYTGVYQGDANVIEDEFIEDISSAEHVILHYKNNNATEVREAFVLVRGELED